MFAIGGTFMVADKFVRTHRPVLDSGSDSGTPWSLLFLRAITACVVILICSWAVSFDGVPPAFFIPQLALLAVGGVHFIVESLIRQLPRGARNLWLASVAFLGGTGASALVALHVPRTIAFELFRSRFDDCAATWPAGRHRIGPWSFFLERDADGTTFLSTFGEQ